MIARINTEQSDFQYKDSVQEMVRSVINAYWNLVTGADRRLGREHPGEAVQGGLDVADANLKIGLGGCPTWPRPA